MSEINDALKRARQAQAQPLDLPGDAGVPTPLPLRAEKPATAFGWMIPAFIVVLVVAAIFFIGWAATHRHVQKIAATPNPVAPIHPAAEAPAVVQASPKPSPAPAPAPATTIVATPVAPK